MSSSNQNTTVTRIGCATYIGGVLAAVCSYSINQSLLWALFHSLWGWFYLAYLLFGFGGGLPSVSM